MKTTAIVSKVAVTGLLVLGLSDVNHTDAVASNYASVYNRNIYNITNIKHTSKSTNISNKRIQEATRASRQMALFNSRVQRIMYGIRMHESHANYKAKSKWSSACGAYQYITSTWNDYKGYKTACAAPALIQDKRMQRDILQRYERYDGDWKKVIAAHLYPKWANNKSYWNHHIPGNPTLNEYVEGVLKYANI